MIGDDEALAFTLMCGSAGNLNIIVEGIALAQLRSIRLAFENLCYDFAATALNLGKELGTK